MSLSCGAKVATVNLSLVVSAPMAHIQKQVDEVLNAYHQEFSLIEKSLREENNGLVETHKKLKNDQEKNAWQQKRQDFEKRIMRVQKDADTKKEKLSKAHEALAQRVQDKVLSIMKRLGEKYKFEGIIPQQWLVYWDPTTDITAEVQKELKKELETASLVIVEELNG